MIPRHSFHILTNKFSLVYKIMLFTTITTIIFTSIVISSLSSILKPITSSIVDLQIFPHLLDAFRSMFGGEPAIQAQAFQQLHTDWLALGEIFVTNEASIIIAIVIFIVIFLIYKIITDFTLLPASDVVNTYMNSNSKYGLVSNCVVNAKKSISYCLVSNVLFLIYYVLVGLIIYRLAKLAFMISTIFGLIMVYISIIFFISLYKAIKVYFIPMYINEKLNVFAAFIKSLKLGFKNLSANLGLYFIIHFIFISFIPVILLSTFTVGLVVMLVIIQVYTLIMDLVIYYRTTGLRYYTDCNVIIDPNTIIGNKI